MSLSLLAIIVGTLVILFASWLFMIPLFGMVPLFSRDCSMNLEWKSMARLGRSSWSSSWTCALWELISMNHDLLVINKSYLYESNTQRQLT
jgi:hypothetical protein